MNPKVTIIFTGMGCFAAGIGVGILAVRAYYQKRTNDEVSAIRELYLEKQRNLQRFRDNLCKAANKKQEERLEKNEETSSEKAPVINYEEIYVPKTGAVKAEDLSAEVRGKKGPSTIYIIKIDEFGTEEGYECETIVYHKINGVMNDPVTGCIIDPEDRFGPELAMTIKMSKEDSIYIRDESIMLDTEVEIINDEFIDPTFS